ncbi:hypothetical protein BDQ12DRAFT_693301 [Crucibulum laeve]|uniref:Uncharacterized protein n=1 Tax=Crucibulum laeve TaxID=68775 RepID=A0A5C3LIA3_9AGAR|nr:hypothetical protein BDQ12DRAFT_693301 [Crucibulum laeve]
MMQMPILIVPPPHDGMPPNTRRSLTHHQIDSESLPPAKPNIIPSIHPSALNPLNVAFLLVGGSMMRHPKLPWFSRPIPITSPSSSLTLPSSGPLSHPASIPPPT